MICVWCKTYMSANAPLLVTGKYLRSGGFLCNKDIGMRSLTSMFWLETKPIGPTPTAYSQTSHITQRKMPSFQVDEMIIIAIVSIWYIYINLSFITSESPMKSNETWLMVDPFFAACHWVFACRSAIGCCKISTLEPRPWCYFYEKNGLNLTNLWKLPYAPSPLRLVAAPLKFGGFSNGTH